MSDLLGKWLFFFFFWQTSVLLNNLAKACVECGKYSEAENMASEAVQRAEESPNQYLPLFLANLGHILSLKGTNYKISWC